jgi:guanylate cyclase
MINHFAFSPLLSDLFWKAPELLRNPNAPIRGTQEGDIYSFAIILFEIIGRKGPYGGVNLEPKGW